MSSDLLGEVVLIVALIALNAILAASEIALVSARRAHLIHLAERKNANAEAALRLLGDTGRFLATVQVGITIAGFFASAVGAVSFVFVFSTFLDRIPVPFIQDISDALAVVVVTLLISFVTIVFGELVPKRVAIRYAETISLAVARPLEGLAVALTPLVAVLTWSANLVLRVLGLGQSIAEKRPTVTEADLRVMFDVAATEGEVEEREAQMLHRIFAFTDKLVKEIMTPRPEILWLDQDATLREFMTLFVESHHAHYPLCDGNPDNMLGLLYIKDVLLAMASGAISPTSHMAQLTRPAYFVPETKRVGELFEEMRSSGRQMAIMVDEYGGTAGLVTLKQLIEEIVGRVGDEIVGQELEYETIDEHTVQVDGAMHLDDAKDDLGLDLPEGDYETVAGFLLASLGHIPQTGEQVRYQDIRLTVTKMSGVKIEKVLVTRS